MLKEYKESNLPRPSEFLIIQEYFKLRGNKIVKSNKPYRVLNNQIFDVKFDKSLMFPVPVEHSGIYPVYDKNQLNDLGNLLLTGIISMI